MAKKTAKQSDLDDLFQHTIEEIRKEQVAREQDRQNPRVKEFKQLYKSWVALFEIVKSQVDPVLHDVSTLFKEIEHTTSSKWEYSHDDSGGGYLSGAFMDPFRGIAKFGHQLSSVESEVRAWPTNKKGSNHTINYRTFLGVDYPRVNGELDDLKIPELLLYRWVFHGWRCNCPPEPEWSTQYAYSKFEERINRATGGEVSEKVMARDSDPYRHYRYQGVDLETNHNFLASKHQRLEEVISSIEDLKKFNLGICAAIVDKNSPDIEKRYVCEIHPSQLGTVDVVRVCKQLFVGLCAPENIPEIWEKTISPLRTAYRSSK